MPKEFDVPLGPEDEQLIKEIGADFDDGPEREGAERLVRNKLQARANVEAAERRVRREAVACGRDIGVEDPERYAQYAVELDRIEKRGARQVAANRQRAKKALRNLANKNAKSVAVASKTAQPSLRRAPEQDRRYVVALGDSERQDLAFSDPLVTSNLKKILKTYSPPHWEKGTIPIKVMAMSVESWKRGARTINLNLTPDICAKALASPRGPASYMQDRVRKRLFREFGKHLEFWLVIERNTDTRFHLHGAVVCDPNDDDVTRRVDQALREAGGEWPTSSAGSLHQQKGRILTDPYVWAGYVVKDFNLTSMAVERKLMASTSELRAVAREAWDNLRKSLPRV